MGGRLGGRFGGLRGRRRAIWGCQARLGRRIVWLPHGMRLSPLVLPPLLRAMAGQSRGEGNVFLGALTQGGARASLTLGYYLVIPTEFQFGSKLAIHDCRVS